MISDCWHFDDFGSAEVEGGIKGMRSMYCQPGLMVVIGAIEYCLGCFGY